MAYREIDWKAKGFGAPPQRRVSGSDGVLLYRCWGDRAPGRGSSEQGKGFFSLDKPRSVLDAELRFNIVYWENGVHFVSTFRLKPGFAYWSGTVAHGASDLRLPGSQIFVEPPLEIKLVLITSREVLRHDVFVGPRDGNVN